MVHEATARVTALREQLTVADGFADSLAGHLDARR
jgi:MerR family transcriptional regulator, copper efflux regulator